MIVNSELLTTMYGFWFIILDLRQIIRATNNKKYYALLLTDPRSLGSKLLSLLSRKLEGKSEPLRNTNHKKEDIICPQAIERSQYPALSSLKLPY